MALSKKERRFWRDKFNITNRADIPEEIDHLNFKDEYLSNEELCYISRAVKRVNRLDLDNCTVDDDGMACLENFESITELRLKGMEVSDRAVVHLNQLITLETLHVGSTKISCDGVAQLTSLTNLKKLWCSPNRIEHEKLKRFLEALPHCELMVNHKLYRPDI